MGTIEGHDCEAAEREITIITAENRMLREALEFYADWESYFGIGFMFDRPCGDFADDFEVVDEPGSFDTPRPGKCARAAFAALASTQTEEK